MGGARARARDDATTSMRATQPSRPRALDRTTRSYREALPNLSATTLEKLHRDCATVYTFVEGSMWLDADSTPRCLLEQMALAIFERHTRGVDGIERAAAGAEWWVQVRMPSEDCDGADAAEADPINFHWDVDEYLQDAMRLTVSPDLSTVTYLCDSGAPTCVIEGARAPARYNVADVYGTLPAATFCFPQVGKLLVFDGAALHGAVPLEAALAATARPAAMRSNNTSRRSSSSGSSSSNGSSSGKKRRRDNRSTTDAEKASPPPPRITLLVNLWLNGHRPTGIEPMIEPLAARLTPIATARSALGMTVRALCGDVGGRGGGASGSDGGRADAVSTIRLGGGGGGGGEGLLRTAFGRTDPPRHELTLPLPGADEIQRWASAGGSKSDTLLVLEYATGRTRRGGGGAASCGASIGPSAHAAEVVEEEEDGEEGDE